MVSCSVRWALTSVSRALQYWDDNLWHGTVGTHMGGEDSTAVPHSLAILHLSLTLMATHSQRGGSRP